METKVVGDASKPTSAMEVAFQHLEAHMLFVCPECGETYNNQQHWRQHLNFFHDYLCKKPEDFGFVEINDRYHECQVCNTMVADGKRAIALLQYHRFMHLPFSRTYRCRHCTASSSRKRMLCEHLCRFHEGVIGDKPKESTSNTVASNNDEVAKTKKNDETKIVDQTNKLKINSVSSNIAKDNPEFYMRFICPQCGKLIDTHKKWIMHIKSAHTEVIRSDCEMQRVTGTKNYYCKICRKVIFSNDNAKLQRHYFMHLPYKVNFLCTYCKIRRAYKTELLHHFIRTHLKEFELQRAYVKKPKEWGAETNKKLDKELDMLLEFGSGYSSKGPSSMKFTSTTLPNTYTEPRNSMKNVEVDKDPHRRSTEKDNINAVQSKKENGTVSSNYLDEFIKATGILNHPCSKKLNRYEKKSNTIKKQEIIEKEPEKKMEDVDTSASASVQNNSLENLCAEIFGDIDLEIFQKPLKFENKKPDKREYSTVAPTTTEIKKEQLEECSEITTDVNNKESLTNDDNDSQQEEIVSIEINTLNLNDVNQFDENDTDQSIYNMMPKPKRLKPNETSLKSLFNAKILHLCPKCGKSFGEQSVWRDHVLNAHENLNKMIENSYKLLEDQDSNLCLNCMQVLTTMNKSELQRHCFTHMPYHAYLKCTLCGIAKSNKSKMLEHLENEHGSLLLKKTTENISEDIPMIEYQGTTTSLSIIDKSSHSLLMKHLLNARERLNGMLASKSNNR